MAAKLTEIYQASCLHEGVLFDVSYEADTAIEALTIAAANGWVFQGRAVDLLDEPGVALIERDLYQYELH